MCDSHCHTQHRTGMSVLVEERQEASCHISNHHGISDQLLSKWRYTYVISVDPQDPL